MMSVLLVAGIGVIVAGLLAIGFGVPVKEFSFGNTLILVGAVAVCTGLVMLSLAVVVRELRAIAQRLGPASSAAATRGRGEAPSAVFGRPEPAEEFSADAPLFSRDQPALEHTEEADPAAPPLPSATSSAAPPAPPWQEEAARTRQRGSAPPPPTADAAPEAKPRRNLLFSSSSRKERERAAARTPDSIASDLDAASSAASETAAPTTATPAPPEAAPRTFEDAWPAAEPARSDPYRRSPRTPSTFNEAASGATPPAATEDGSEVTVLKSGVVDGMAYSLYSDGSIEAQMPEGMMRFASIGELRAHLDQRP
jgi:hypothetical protein